MSNETVEIVFKITMGVLIASFTVTMVRLIIGPRLYNRVVALDLITSIAAGIILVYALMVKQSFYMDVAVIIFMIAFIGTVAISKYLIKTGRDE